MRGPRSRPGPSGVDAPRCVRAGLRARGGESDVEFDEVGGDGPALLVGGGLVGVGSFRLR